MSSHIAINGRHIGPGCPVYVIAEMSANHGQSFEQAVKIIEAAKRAGADAIKLQTYTPDTLTIDCDKEHFKIRGTLWSGRTLYDLYSEAFTPWEWQPKLKQVADSIGIDFFSTPFDPSAIELLERMNVPAHKIASFENIDLELVRSVAKTGKPVIASTGMATLGEIDELVRSARAAGARELALLKCTSAYPAPPDEMNLRTIPHLAAAYTLPVGLSDHTLGWVAPVTAAALGACIIEKHLTLARADGGPDSAFSLEPAEFKCMVDAVRSAEKMLGCVEYGVSAAETRSRAFRRSLFVVENMRGGETFTRKNVRSIRPGDGLHPRHLTDVLGHTATESIERGTPLSWAVVGAYGAADVHEKCLSEQAIREVPFAK